MMIRTRRKVSIVRLILLLFAKNNKLALIMLKGDHFLIPPGVEENLFFIILTTLIPVK